MEEQLVNAREIVRKKYVLLTPGDHPARTGPTYQRLCNWQHIEDTISTLRRSQYVAVDFETRGGDYSRPIDIIGIGLAWDSGSAFFYFPTLSRENQTRLLMELQQHSGLLAHNIYFDGGVYFQNMGAHASWHMCTLSAVAHLANEGHPGANWGLKLLMRELLGWLNSNEEEMEAWLVSNGYYRGNRRLTTDPAELLQAYQDGTLRPDRGDMWRVPSELLGKYCVLDAEACYILYTEVLRPVLDKFPALDSFLAGDFLQLTLGLVEQKIHGIPVDRAGMITRRSVVEQDMDALEKKFLTHPDVIPHIAAIEKKLRAPLYEKEPDKIKKDGGISKNWTKWQERVEAAEAGLTEAYNFNIQSGAQLRTVLYDGLGLPVRMESESGLPSVSVKTLKHMGDVGKILQDRMWSLKEHGYLEKYLDLTQYRNTIHPSFRTPGTMTGRLSSSEPNMQQIPKTRAMMELFTARPGHVWIDLDFSALEPVVATEFSGDPNMLLIYGDGRPPNDIYLFVGAHIPGEIGSAIRATGYDPHNPSPAALSKAKKECKHWRSICKTVVLACQYGAGINKIIEVLELDDIFLLYEQVAAIHSTYWELFAGVKDFGRKLFYEWRRNGGYILNGMDRPMAVPEEMNKDLLNRFIQSTGHDILVKYVNIYRTELQSRGIPYRPLILDWHDSSAVEVLEEHKNAVIEVMQGGVVELNNLLQGTIQLRGEPDVGYNLADIKKPEE